ncbi:MAG: rRNA maturation RNase YbeY [Lachnospiraceae bacterium]
MTVTVETEEIPEFDFPYETVAKEVVEAAIEIEKFPYEAEVTILLVSTLEIQEINREHRKIDRPTDVLSFPMINYEIPGEFSSIDQDEDNFNPDTGEALLGDVILCIDKVKEQAERFGHSQKREFAFLILHSMLHLFGYDHMTEEEAIVMEEKQRNILNQIGILR